MTGRRERVAVLTRWKNKNDRVKNMREVFGTSRFICIPYRTEIRHKYAYHFRKSKRSKEHRSGLDFTKMIIIKDDEFIDSKEAEIDADEYAETRKNIYVIVKRALAFLEDYIMHNTGKKILNQREYDRRYKFSSLKYFHDELGIVHK